MKLTQKTGTIGKIKRFLKNDINEGEKLLLFENKKKIEDDKDIWSFFFLIKDEFLDCYLRRNSKVPRNPRK